MFEHSSMRHVAKPCEDEEQTWLLKEPHGNLNVESWKSEFKCFFFFFFIVATTKEIAKYILD